MVIVGILLALSVLAFMLLARLITTFIHEMGHAIPALYFTEEPVTIYVGSYKDISKSYKFQSGRLTAYISFDILGWNIGLCTLSRKTSFQQDLLVTLGGPLASLFFGIFLIGVIRNWGLTDGQASLAGILMISSIWDFFVNITPQSSPIYLHDGSMTFNDGQQILNRLRARKLPPLYFEAQDDLDNEKYEEALSKFQSLIQDGFKKREIQDLILATYIRKKDFQAALNHVDEHFYDRNLSWDDYLVIGMIYAGLKDFQEAIKYYNSAIHLNHNDPTSRNLRGFALLQEGAYDAAFQDFEAAISYHKTFAEAYSNRGMTKVQMGYLEDGETDILQALAIDSENALAYLYLGKLYEKKQNFRKALGYYEKAKALDVDHHGINFYIEEVRRVLNYD